MTDDQLRVVAKQLMNKSVEELNEFEKRVLSHIARDAHISRHPVDDDDENRPTAGERIADRVASFGGSWLFISLFMGLLLLWCAINVLLVTRDAAFDPYPFVFLNLILSMLAALQAPIIMMSQNRQAQKDRINALHDYEVNLKAELDIMTLHDKLDEIRDQRLAKLMLQQEEQLEILKRMVTETARRA